MQGYIDTFLLFCQVHPLQRSPPCGQRVLQKTVFCLSPPRLFHGTGRNAGHLCQLTTRCLWEEMDQQLSSITLPSLSAVRDFANLSLVDGLAFMQAPVPRHSDHGVCVCVCQCSRLLCGKWRSDRTYEQGSFAILAGYVVDFCSTNHDCWVFCWQERSKVIAATSASIERTVARFKDGVGASLGETQMVSRHRMWTAIWTDQNQLL